MKSQQLIFCTFLIALTAGCSDKLLSQAIEHQQWKLIWEDAFNAQFLDTSKWNYEVNNDGGGNNELQYYTARDSNIFLKNGLLHIVALKEAYNNRSYTSGRINTKNKVDRMFGKIVARARIPAGAGLWPAFWMLPTNDKFGGWPLSGEIDILETKGQAPDTAYATIHYGPAWPNNRYKGTIKISNDTGGFANSFHTYSIIWQKNKIAWLIDDVKYFEINNTEIKDVAYPFNEKFHLILNLAIGGNFVGSVDDSKLPGEFLIDYVQVWELK